MNTSTYHFYSTYHFDSLSNKLFLYLYEYISFKQEQNTLNILLFIIFPFNVKIKKDKVTQSPQMGIL